MEECTRGAEKTMMCRCKRILIKLGLACDTGRTKIMSLSWYFVDADALIKKMYSCLYICKYLKRHITNNSIIVLETMRHSYDHTKGIGHHCKHVDRVEICPKKICWSSTNSFIRQSKASIIFNACKKLNEASTEFAKAYFNVERCIVQLRRLNIFINN